MLTFSCARLWGSLLRSRQTKGSSPSCTWTWLKKHLGGPLYAGPTKLRQSYLLWEGRREGHPGGEELRDIDTVLNLASTFFICSSCCSCPYYPDHKPSFGYKGTIMHACATGKDRDHPSQSVEPFQSLYQNPKKLPWNHWGKISFDTDAYCFMLEVITVCGLDPDKTTAQCKGDGRPWSSIWVL